jgi:uncharacterized protein YjiS (DUF1127 family)
MTTTSYNMSVASLQPTREISRSLLGQMAMFLYQPLLLASRQVAIRRARRELLELPDSMLKDMGITRGEITSVVEYGRADVTRVSRFDSPSVRS